MNKLRAVIRIEQDGTPALFYRDGNQLVCFTFKEGHTTASIEYFNKETVGLNRHKEWMYNAYKIEKIRAKFAAYYAPATLDFKLTLG